MYGMTIKAKYLNKKGQEVELEMGVPKDVPATAKAFASWMGNRTTVFLNTGPVTEQDEITWLNSQKEDRDSLEWIIYAGDELVGVSGLHKIDLVNRNAELGIMIANKEHWGRGIATVAEIAITEYAANNVAAGGLHKIKAYVLTRDDGTGNDASRAAITKVGYREVGVYRESVWVCGKWYDEWACEMLMEEWRKVRLQIMRAAGVKSLDLYPGLEDKGFRPVRIE